MLPNPFFWRNRGFEESAFVHSRQGTSIPQEGTNANGAELGDDWRLDLGAFPAEKVGDTALRDFGAFLAEEVGDMVLRKLQEALDSIFAEDDVATGATLPLGDSGQGLLEASFGPQCSPEAATKPASTEAVGTASGPHHYNGLEGDNFNNQAFSTQGGFTQEIYERS
eukprot:TRINITY_DN7243_c0_g2_i1.p1 TRINITY_DN7243_c0_g2~~TRINITY_DN7243_c0_g2_i1.p1  ORF type:complete len:167 (+),score=25.37 TRINITY_DN7243_c0_g2_i1:529-1029(+)